MIRKKGKTKAKKGEIMTNVDYNSEQSKAPLNHRIIASMPVQATWVDADSGKKIVVAGLTEHVGENSTLVNLDVLPPVGSQVKLKLLREDKPIIEVSTRVIRVERDPSKPMAALSVLENLKKWKQTAITAAQEWVTRHWQLNYEEEWVN